jgi:hypothetical protein
MPIKSRDLPREDGGPYSRDQLTGGSVRPAVCLEYSPSKPFGRYTRRHKRHTIKGYYRGTGLIAAEQRAALSL